MKRIIFTVGAAGAGKSTWVKNNFNLVDSSIIRINADAIRYMLYGDENIQGNGKDIFYIVYTLFEQALHTPSIETIIVDNTNINYQVRKMFYKMIDFSKCDVFLKIFSDHVQAIHQNKNRERVVPDEVVMRMINRFEGLCPEESNLGVKLYE
jgi:predicted kinase